jgi:hypothetical protein
VVTELRVYFEGDDRLRPGFRQFLRRLAEAARSKRCRFELIATDGTPTEDYLTGLKANPEAWNVLLLDAEDESEAQIRKKSLDGCDSESIRWMVQLMEAWFLADVDGLKTLFKERLQEQALKGNPKVEEIPKADVMARLKRATSGEYHKVKHGTKPLELIDSVKVRKAAPNCDRMFRVILTKLG